jgi:hypothetical protein
LRVRTARRNTSCCRPRWSRCEMPTTSVSWVSRLPPWYWWAEVSKPPYYVVHLCVPYLEPFDTLAKHFFFWGGIKHCFQQWYQILYHSLA